MKPLALRAFFVFILVSFAVDFSAVRAADTNPPSRLTVELRDGSRVIGASGEKYFKFHSSLLGDLKLAVKDIRSVEWVSTNSAKLTTSGGDTLTVSFMAAEFAVETSFGKIELPVNFVRKFTVSATGNVSPRHEGLVVLWSGEGNANDSVDDHNGILKGGVGFGSGKFGQAFLFNGTSSYVEVPDSPSLRLTNELTIEFWFKRLSRRANGEYILNKGGNWNSGPLNYGVCLDPDSIGTGVAFLFAGGNRHAGSITDTNWHHFAVVVINGQADPVFYIDGELQPVWRREGAATINLSPSTKPLYIGAQIDPSSGWMFYGNTSVDELALYNCALTADEIHEDFEAGNHN